MHRVELKVKNSLHSAANGLKVPNAPCGVESKGVDIGRVGGERFLMHRVELKVPYLHPCRKSNTYVPNAPCGVESCVV